MDNLELYNNVRSVPQTAQRQIEAGRLKGKTDINPMWRIKALTEQFGVCGIGWKVNITKQWIEQGANGEISAFCNIELFIKNDNEWSEPICGTGGSSYISTESKKDENGNRQKVLYTSDECYKMAYTDAISVACKMLGFGADVYWQKDTTKYDKKPEEESTGQKAKAELKQVVQPYESGKMTLEQAKNLEVTTKSGEKKKLNDFNTDDLRKLVNIDNPKIREASGKILDARALVSNLTEDDLPFGDKVND